MGALADQATALASGAGSLPGSVSSGFIASYRYLHRLQDRGAMCSLLSQEVYSKDKTTGKETGVFGSVLQKLLPECTLEPLDFCVEVCKKGSQNGGGGDYKFVQVVELNSDFTVARVVTFPSRDAVKSALGLDCLASDSFMYIHEDCRAAGLPVENVQFPTEKVPFYGLGRDMRTVSGHGLKFKPQLWLAASQIKSWFSKKASEKKKATSVVLLGKFQAQAGAALAAFQKDAAALDDSSDDSGSESGE
jgi:hypothetical protein